MIKILSPAKINLFLEVGPFDEGIGLHHLISFVDIVNLYDIIEIEEAEKTEVNFISDWEIPVENTVTRTISLIRDVLHINRNVRVIIRKRIPPGTGLGGGSSNAAAVLKVLVDIWNIKVENETLGEIGLKIGSDVPLFIKGKRCVIGNLGEKVLPERISTTPLVYYLLMPPFNVSTGEVYKHLDSRGVVGDLTLARHKVKILNEYIEKKNIEGIENNMFNRLEEAYLDLYKESKEVKERVEKETGKKFFVSGSGGTLFCIFFDREEAEKKMLFLDIERWKGCLVESVITS